ncbi:MAG: ATP-binding protein [Acidobacteriota bacterium]
MTKRVWLSWSSGKDSAWALHRMRQEGEHEVCGLFTTVNAHFDRVAMHAVRRSLLERQAQAAGLPLAVINLPWPCSNSEYEKIMSKFCQEAVEQEVQGFAFGDLFLEDVRQYRISHLKQTPLEPIFPLWKIPTPSLAREMIGAGLRAKLTCVNPKQLSRSFAGRNFDLSLLADLPEDVDPCGENGEFHSFVYAGPMFEYPFNVHIGEITERDGFIFADVLPKTNRGVV